MMKRLTILLVIFTAGIFSTFGQTAESVLDKSANKIKSAKGINVSFSLTQKDAQGHVQSVSKGTMKIKGEKYYIKQEGNEIYCDGIKLWNFDGANEVTVTSVNNNEDELSPQQILTGFNKKDFAFQMISAAAPNYQIQLTPLDKRQNFKQVILFINKSTNLISKASVIDKMNKIIEIGFTNISLNASFADSQFIFDASKHQGIEVINN